MKNNSNQQKELFEREYMAELFEINNLELTQNQLGHQVEHLHPNIEQLRMLNERLDINVLGSQNYVNLINLHMEITELMDIMESQRNNLKQIITRRCGAVTELQSTLIIQQVTVSANYQQISNESEQHVVNNNLFT